MKNLSRTLGAISMAVVLGFTSAAVLAQPNGHPGQRDGARDNHRGHNVQPPRAQPSHGKKHHVNPPQRHAPSHMHRDARHRDDGRRDGGYASHGRRGAGPQHNWHRGGRVPPSYRGYNYVVNDWRGHHLSAPPRGYHWIQNGPDYLLVAVATGVIAQLILSN